MLTNVREISKDDLLESVQELARTNHRLISITATEVAEGFDLIYHFAQGMTLTNLRFTIEYDQEVPSITPFYFCAFVPENELKDFHGIKITNLPINYRQLFILSELTPIKTPLAPKVAAAAGTEVLPE